MRNIDKITSITINQIPNEGNGYTAIITKTLIEGDKQYQAIGSAQPSNISDSRDIQQLFDYASQQASLRIANTENDTNHNHLESNLVSTEVTHRKPENWAHNQKRRSITDGQNRMLHNLASERQIDLNSYIHEQCDSSIEELSSHQAHILIGELKRM